MSRMLAKMNLISVVQQLPKEDIEIIQGYVEMIENENQKYKDIIDKSIELTKNLLKTEDRGYYQILFKEILKNLGDKE